MHVTLPALCHSQGIVADGAAVAAFEGPLVAKLPLASIALNAAAAAISAVLLLFALAVGSCRACLPESAHAASGPVNPVAAPLVQTVGIAISTARLGSAWLPPPPPPPPPPHPGLQHSPAQKLRATPPPLPARLLPSLTAPISTAGGRSAREEGRCSGAYGARCQRDCGGGGVSAASGGAGPPSQGCKSEECEEEASAQDAGRRHALIGAWFRGDTGA